MKLEVKWYSTTAFSIESHESEDNKNITLDFT